MKPGQLDALNDRPYRARLLAFILLGGAVALLLTWFMHQLIHSSQHRLDESSRAHLVDFVRLKRNEASLRKDRRPPRPTTEEAPPAPATPQADIAEAETTLAVSESLLPDDLGADLKIGGLGFDSSDGEYLPIVKIAPIYPRRAQAMSLEGECVVVYTVTTSGATRDVRVIESMCDDPLFYRASIAAAEKFKYKPRVIDGEAVEVHDVTNRFIYEIPDEIKR